MVNSHITNGQHFILSDYFTFVLFDAAEKNIKDCDEKSIDKTNIISAIILSFAALESCVNMYFTLFIENNDKKEEKNRIEPAIRQYLCKEKTGIENKLLIWTKLATGKTFDKGEPWQSFQETKVLRNKIMHFKLKKDTSKIEIVMFKNIQEDLYDGSLLNELTLENAKKSYNVAKEMIIKLQEFMGWPILDWMNKKL